MIGLVRMVCNDADARIRARIPNYYGIEFDDGGDPTRRGHTWAYASNEYYRTIDLLSLLFAWPV